jgi:hypothetical protein
MNPAHKLAGKSRRNRNNSEITGLVMYASQI